MFDNPTTKLTNPDALSAATTNAVKNVIDKDIKEANFFGSLIELFNQIKDHLISEFEYYKSVYKLHGILIPNSDTSFFEQIFFQMLQYNRGVAIIIMITGFGFIRILFNLFFFNTLKKKPQPIKFNQVYRCKSEQLVKCVSEKNGFKNRTFI